MFGSKGIHIANSFNTSAAFDKVLTTTSCICESDDGEYKVSVTTNEPNGTCMTQLYDVKSFMTKLFDPNLTPEDYRAFNTLCGFFPCRTKGKNYIENCMGMFSKDEVKEIKVRMNDILKAYTSIKDLHAIMNLMLAFDAPADVFARKLPEIGIQCNHYIKLLKCCIGLQTEKFSGICYRVGFLNPMELFTMTFKGIFYISQFFSTSTNRDAVIKYFKGNVLYEIDTTEFNNFTTLINKKTQTIYPEEEENLISCYNIYQYIHHYLGYNFVIIRLKLLNYHDLNDLTQHTIKDAKHGDFPLKYMKSGLNTVRDKCLAPDKLFDTCNMIKEDYNKSIELKKIEENKKVLEEKKKIVEAKKKALKEHNPKTPSQWNNLMNIFK